MAKSENKKQTWRDKFRFTIFNDTTFEEVWRIRLTQYNAFLLVSAIILFIIGGTYSLLAFTNLRELIPGYPDVTMRRNILINAIRLDSLEHELALRDMYFNNLKSIVSGNTPAEIRSVQDTSVNYKLISFNRSPQDSLLRDQIENEEKYNLVLGPVFRGNVTSFSGLHFFPPVKGIISGRYDPRTRHFGCDIVTKPKASVSAALDGTIIFTGWTMETGFVIQIQHANNLISVYKHNANLLKETGDFVRAGEAISIVGDSGELYTSGPHLHLEIWYKGNPLDPEKHILF